jgi:DNA-binding SARP family transcriptional activator
MRPLSKEEETDAEVTWEDQNNINAFSKLHNKLIDLQDLLAEKSVTSLVAISLTLDTSRINHGCVTRD